MALLFRLRADQKVYNATTGTTAASDGGSVGSWEPYEGLISTRALHATKGPTYRANDNSSGYPGLEWSAGKLLTMAHSSEWVGWTSFSWLIVGRNFDVSSSSQYRYLFSKASTYGSWDRFGLRINQANYSEDLFTFHPGAYGDARQSETVQSNTSGRFVLAGSADGSKLCTYVNTRTATRNPKSNTITIGTSPFTIGEDVDASGTYNLTQGTFYEIALWNAALSETEMATELTSAMSRWGITETLGPASSGGGLLVAPGMNGGLNG